MATYEYDLPYAYLIRNRDVILLEIDEETGYYTAPSQSITYGIKFEYSSGATVFVDSNGASADSAPTESSYINCTEAEIPALLAHIKAQLETDPRIQMVREDEFNRKFLTAKERQRPEVKQVYPLYPYRF